MPWPVPPDNSRVFPYNICIVSLLALMPYVRDVEAFLTKESGNMKRSILTPTRLYSFVSILLFPVKETGRDLFSGHHKHFSTANLRIQYVTV